MCGIKGGHLTWISSFKISGKPWTTSFPKRQEANNSKGDWNYFLMAKRNVNFMNSYCGHCKQTAVCPVWVCSSVSLSLSFTSFSIYFCSHSHAVNIKNKSQACFMLLPARHHWSNRGDLYFISSLFFLWIQSNVFASCSQSKEPLDCAVCETFKQIFQRLFVLLRI